MAQGIDWPSLAYGIRMPGLSIEEFEADGKWGMQELSPLGLLVPLPLTAEGVYEASLTAPSLEDVLFVADCIAFDHDSPTVVVPLQELATAPYEPVGHDRPWIAANRTYRDILDSVAEQAHEIRYTDALRLRYGTYGDPLTRFSGRFAGRSEPLALYATAIRHVDLLAEYMGLYRVLETPRRDNGLGFITDHLDSLERYDFGKLLTIPAFLPRHAEEPIEVFSVLRERALGRLEALRTAGIDTARHLYAIRNGLAHGKQDLILNDFGNAVDAVAADLPLLKLLARIAVEQG
ncbi:methylamine utilization protein MauJ (plasmid) [Streptomyces sp. GDS52]|uniref:methylamine utilization protein MauJ n=1 Tax=Streptomyces sp. GDS52 TaxID=3406419 RepID=UPI003FD21C2F